MVSNTETCGGKWEGEMGRGKLVRSWKGKRFSEGEYRNLWGEMGLVMGKGDEGEEGKEDEEDEGEGLLFMDDDPMDVD